MVCLLLAPNIWNNANVKLDRQPLLQGTSGDKKRGRKSSLTNAVSSLFTRKPKMTEEERLAKATEHKKAQITKDIEYKAHQIRAQKGLLVDLKSKKVHQKVQEIREPEIKKVENNIKAFEKKKKRLEEELRGLQEQSHLASEGSEAASNPGHA